MDLKFLMVIFSNFLIDNYHLLTLQTWSRVFFQTRVRNWYHDTMLAAHVLDNRSSITSIKFQAFVRYGLGNYDQQVAPYIESGDKNANAFNRISQVSTDSLLKYCGYDSFLEWLTARDQRHEMHA